MPTEAEMQGWNILQVIGYQMAWNDGWRTLLVLWLLIGAPAALVGWLRHRRDPMGWMPGFRIPGDLIAATSIAFGLFGLDWRGYIGSAGSHFMGWALLLSGLPLLWAFGKLADKAQYGAARVKWHLPSDASLAAVRALRMTEPAKPGEASWLGRRLVAKAGEGEASILEARSRAFDMRQAAEMGRVHGVPGGGLSSSGFNRNAVGAGQRGEETLARIVLAACPNVVGYFSLYGTDLNGNLSDSDIDAAFVGVDSLGRTRIWLVDAKNYKGGSDTVYMPWQEYAGAMRRKWHGISVPSFGMPACAAVARISVSQKAFMRGGASPSPLLDLSANMSVQKRMWKPTVLNEKAEWLVCMVPGADGAPRFEASYPGNIPVVSAEDLVREIESANLVEPERIPRKTQQLLGARVKGGDVPPSYYPASGYAAPEPAEYAPAAPAAVPEPAATEHWETPAPSPASAVPVAQPEEKFSGAWSWANAGGASSAESSPVPPVPPLSAPPQLPSKPDDTGDELSGWDWTNI